MNDKAKRRFYFSLLDKQGNQRIVSASNWHEAKRERTAAIHGIQHKAVSPIYPVPTNAVPGVFAMVVKKRGAHNG